MSIPLLIIGLYLMGLSVMMDTENLASAVIFRLIPSFSGLYLVFYYLMEKGFINIP